MFLIINIEIINVLKFSRIFSPCFCKINNPCSNYNANIKWIRGHPLKKFVFWRGKGSKFGQNLLTDKRKKKTAGKGWGSQNYEQNEDVVLDTKMWLKMKLPVHFRSVAVYLKKNWRTFYHAYFSRFVY